MPKVSIIIPVYNASGFLDDCLNSVINQTLKDIEIICIDDGSTDKSLEILNDYASKDNRIIVIKQENKGAGAARNLGMKYACGKYYSFLDADDFFEEDMLEKAYLTAENNRSQIVVFGCDTFINSKRIFEPCNYSIQYNLLPENKTFAGIEIKKDIFKVFVGWAWDKLFLADYIRANNIIFQEQRTTNDMLFVFSALVKAESITVLSDILAHHRIEEGSLSVTREYSWHCFYDALLSLKQQLINWNLYDRFQQDYINYCIHFSLWNLKTLKEPTRVLLYNKLRDEWFEQMGVTKFDRSYFYNDKEYMMFMRIIEHPEDWEPTRRYIRKLKQLENKEKLGKIISAVRAKGLIYVLSLVKSKLSIK